MDTQFIKVCCEVCEQLTWQSIDSNLVTVICEDCQHEIDKALSYQD